MTKVYGAYEQNPENESWRRFGGKKKGTVRGRKRVGKGERKKGRERVKMSI